ncbi:hypothetical protein KIN20_032726 [Parelaphostrongylus tenuis]|uniref:39S ribosomal protein L49, mitochondrial n=1 Tax=Parelaphostrongylus tenuis TaxID=148309 RepID=A0AAD5R775_PARTN|nr:hypothetical protein KIN20_032726 [Parelaphostrongylus tenuis]
MLRSLSRVLLRGSRSSLRTLSTATHMEEEDESKPWINPWKHALPKRTSTYTGVEEVNIDWSFVERLMPHDIVPPLPVHQSYPTPSGWQPPKIHLRSSILRSKKTRPYITIVFGFEKGPAEREDSRHRPC